MSYANSIIKTVSNRLNNPIAGVLKDIRITKILKQSKIDKKDGAPISDIILHFIFMIILGKTIPSFVKYSKESFGKDTYYRALVNSKYNWQKLLLSVTMKLIGKVATLQRGKVTKVLILDDTIEDKRGKKIPNSEIETKSKKFQ